MNDSNVSATLPIRLPESTRAKAALAARLGEVSLNDFILLAIAEKIARSEFSVHAERRSILN